jgi:hypothetical protein
MYIVYNRKNGKILKSNFKSIAEATKEAEKQNIICKAYNFMVIKIK